MSAPARPMAKPMARPASPRAVRPDSASSARPASSSSDKKEKKPKAKKPKAPPQAPGAAPLRPTAADPTLVIGNIEQLSEEQAKKQLGELQKKYGALIVNFNNQQAELAASQKRLATAEQRLAAMEQMQRGQGPVGGEAGHLNEQLQSTLAVRACPPARCPKGDLALMRGPPTALRCPARAACLARPSDDRPLRDRWQDLRAAEAQNMQLQKRINKLQVEHVSEEEVDQLFYALELKEQQLAQAQRDKAGVEEQLLTARQLTARGTNYEPKFIEIHHNNNLSDDDSDEDSDEDDDEKD